MPFKNKRNSRDDKSEKSSRSSKPSSGSAPKGNSYKSDRTEGSNTFRKKLFGDDHNKSFKSGPAKPGARSGSDFNSENRAPKSFGKSGSGEKRSFSDRAQGGDKPFGDRKPAGSREFKTFDKNGPAKKFGERPFKPRTQERSGSFDKPKYRTDDRKWSSEERFDNKRSKKPSTAKDDGLIRLNRFIANAGICSRRKADELIAAGVVSVNGEPVTELGFKVDPGKDVIRYNGETLKREKMVYVLLNKPKDYITTTDDPQERKTVMALVDKASKERIYPVGRLDRNTTGLLLMTNDGDLADKLSHPKNNITKLYNVELNKNLSQGDMNKILFGLELEDGFIKPDQVSYVAGASKKEVGIQIHSGKNRIVRRIFESLGYEVVKLDRVVYSNLTKKDLGRGKWRYLEEKEIIQLKHLIK